jgi:hypothetical protein
MPALKTQSGVQITHAFSRSLAYQRFSVMLKKTKLP